MNTGVKWKRFSLLGLGAFCLAALPALGDVPGNGSQNYPEPGTLNYVQGSAYLEGHELNDRDLNGSELAPGQVLHTTTGRAEVLLTPGVFLRLGEHTRVKMISPDIFNTKVELLQGEAGIEVDEIHPQNNLEMVDNGVTTRLEKRGFYEFLATPAKVRVFTGEARVETGSGPSQDVKKHHEMILQADAQQKPQDFKLKNDEDALFNWSKLRSQYLAEANHQYAKEYGYVGSPGWYWNPMGMGWDMAWGPGWGWGPRLGWGFGPAWGWGPGWGWGGPGFWRGPVFYRREPDRDDLPGPNGNLHGDFHGGTHRERPNGSAGSLRGGGSFRPANPGGHSR
ncbi:MAG TPA: hypothetical protein VF730_15435 [Terracidiphilus sp.]